MQFKALATLGFAFAAGVLSKPQINSYDAKIAGNLSSTAALLSNSTIVALLRVIENYGLKKYYGVYSVHEHLNLTQGGAAFQTYGNSSLEVTSVVEYRGIAAFSVPTIYGIDFANSSLIPLEFTSGDAFDLAGLSALSAAISNGFVNDFISVLGSVPAAEKKVAGLGLLTGIVQTASGDYSKAILVSNSEDKNVKVASIVPISSVNTTLVEPTLFTASNDSASPFHVLAWCAICSKLPFPWTL